MYTKIEQEIFNERIPKIFFGICLERKEYHRGAYSMEATGAEKGMFSEEEQWQNTGCRWKFQMHPAEKQSELRIRAVG